MDNSNFTLDQRSNGNPSNRHDALSHPVYARQLEKDNEQSSFHFYEGLMRHDAHRKVRGRTRQRRWGKP